LWSKVRWVLDYVNLYPASAGTGLGYPPRNFSSQNATHELKVITHVLKPST